MLGLAEALDGGAIHGGGFGAFHQDGIGRNGGGFVLLRPPRLGVPVGAGGQALLALGGADAA